MVVLFSERKSKAEREISEILKGYGACCISDKSVSLSSKGKFTVVSEYKKTKLELSGGTVLFTDSTNRFSDQALPHGMVGICEENNFHALEIFMENGIEAITCGMSSKNTVTVSSIGDRHCLVAFQRALKDNCGRTVYPREYSIGLQKSYNPFSVMASAAALILNGITPDLF